MQFGLLRALTHAPVHLHPVAHLHLDRHFPGEDEQPLGGGRVVVRLQTLYPEAPQVGEEAGDHALGVHEVQFVGGGEARPLDGVDRDAVADEGEERQVGLAGGPLAGPGSVTFDGDGTRATRGGHGEVDAVPVVGRQRGDHPAQPAVLLFAAVLDGGQGGILDRQGAGDGHAGEGRVGVVEDGEGVGQHLAGEDIVGSVGLDCQHGREDLDDVGGDAGLEFELDVVHLADAG